MFISTLGERKGPEPEILNLSNYSRYRLKVVLFHSFQIAYKLAEGARAKIFSLCLSILLPSPSPCLILN